MIQEHKAYKCVNTNQESEFLEIKNLLLEIKEILNLTVPKVFELGYVVQITGKSRQTISQYLKDNYRPQVYFWKNNGKIAMPCSVALDLIRRYNRC